MTKVKRPDLISGLDIDSILEKSGLADIEMPVIPDGNSFPHLFTGVFLLDPYTLAIYQVKDLNYKIIPSSIGSPERHIAILTLAPQHLDIKFTNGKLEFSGLSSLTGADFTLDFTSEQYEERMVPVTREFKPINPKQEALFKTAKANLIDLAIEKAEKLRREKDIPQTTTQDSGSW